MDDDYRGDPLADPKSLRAIYARLDRENMEKTQRLMRIVRVLDEFSEEQLIAIIDLLSERNRKEWIGELRAILRHCHGVDMRIGNPPKD